MAITDDAANTLEAELQGELIRPSDAGYDEARAIWNGMIDRRPALIARCAAPGDAAAAVRLAASERVPLAVRGGGHGVAGHAVCDDGIVVDLSAMREIEVDAGAATVRAQGGATLADIDAATQEHGLATPMGVVTKTGIAGLTLSGGIGWLRRKHGLSVDNLVAAEVVTADGSVLTASESENEDLFWALRGGGGNFGAVTSLTYRAHPIGPEVFFCFVLYPAARANEVLRACERYLAEADEPIAPLGVLGKVPEADEFPAEQHGKPYVALLAMHTGDASDGEAVMAPLRELGDPIGDLSGTMPYTEAQGVLDEDYPDGWRYYWKSVNVRELSDEVVDGLVAQNEAAPSSHSTIDVWFQGGAIADVDEQATAFGNRGAPFLLGIEGNWEGGGNDEANVAWVRETVELMRPHSDGGMYLNFPGFLEEGEQLVREGYGPNYERLAEVKSKYDPDNLFRLNANVQPAG